MSSIAARAGFRSHETVYCDPANAELRAKRHEPSELHPGDVVTVPDRELRTEEAPTTRRTAFVIRRSERTYVKLRLRYRRRLAYRITTSLGVTEGIAEGSSMFQAEVPRDAATASLLAWLPDQELHPDDGGPALRFEIDLGCLAPLGTLRGVQGRLRNLGYDPGTLTEDVSATADARTTEAIRAFQRAEGLSETGAIDDVRARLFELHDGG